MSEKTFELHWKNQRIELVKGFTMPDAFKRAGYDSRCYRLLDYYRELKDLK